MYNWVTVPNTRNYHNIVNQPYFNKKRNSWKSWLKEGFPVSSPQDFNGLNHLSGLVSNPWVFCGYHWQEKSRKEKRISKLN